MKLTGGCNSYSVKYEAHEYPGSLRNEYSGSFSISIIQPLKIVNCTVSSDSEYLNRLSNSVRFRKGGPIMDAPQRNIIIFYDLNNKVTIELV
jgi:hypothetical protein